MWNRTEIEIELTLIRHGETQSNLERRYLGRMDEALSEEGIRRLKKKKEEGRCRLSGALFGSPMLRCRQTKELLFPEAECQWIPEWRELDFGLFEGKTYRELNGNAAYQAWIDSGGILPFPEGEGRDAFCGRVMRGLLRALIRLQNTEKQEDGKENEWKMTAVVHGGTIMALCSSLFEGDYFDYQVPCGEGYRCRFRYGRDHRMTGLEIHRL